MGGRCANASTEVTGIASDGLRRSTDQASTGGRCATASFEVTGITSDGLRRSTDQAFSGRTSLISTVNVPAGAL